jgi:ribosomal protein S18 acetylase RimI-like enzyme
MPESSFGIEYEFGFVNERDVISCSIAGDRYAHTDNWGYQDDPTAGAEVWTPVFTDINEAFESHARQWRYWMNENHPYVPYMCNHRGWSIGVHVHIGRPDRRLTDSERRQIARSIAIAYPYLMALHAQPIPSMRGLSSRYAYPIWQAQYRIPVPDHYAEISASHIGTVEFRIFDSNIPQATLTCVSLMKALADKMVSSYETDNYSITDRTYRQDRERALRFGVIGLDVAQYLRYIKNVVGNVEIPNVNSVREILYLSAKYFMNVWNVKQTLHVKDYMWFKSMLDKPSEFLSNIVEMVPNRFVEKVNTWRREASRMNTLDDLIRVAESSRNVFIRALNENVERAMVTCVGREVAVLRINEVPNISRDEVAREVERLLLNEGDNFVQPYSARDIISLPQRFYVACVRANESDRATVVGAISVHVSDGEIGSLVVDRRFRRRGVARQLVNHVLTLGLPRYTAYVRDGNLPSRALFGSMGFTESEVVNGGRWLEYVRR